MCSYNNGLSYSQQRKVPPRQVSPPPAVLDPEGAGTAAALRAAEHQAGAKHNAKRSAD